MSRASGIVALGLALCLLGGAFGATALLVPGITLLLLVGWAQASVRLPARRAYVRREPAAVSVEEEQEVQVKVSVGGRLLSLGGAELCSWPGAPFRPLSRLPSSALGFRVRPQRRGLHTIGPTIVRFRDPFGICARVRESPGTDVLVLPRVERIADEHLARLLGARRGAAPAPGRMPGADLDGLRPYRPGAPASRIHWPTVARTGELLERQFHAESEQQPLVVLDARRPVSVEALDMCVRAAASLCVGLARGGRGCSLLLPGAPRAVRLRRDLRAWPAQHARLALVQPGEGVLASAVERGAIVLWVTASEQPQPVAGVASESQFTVSPFPVTERQVLFAVAGCSVQRARAGLAARAA